jgi:hypothetical protein
MDGDGAEEIGFQSDRGAAGVIGGFIGTARTGRLHMVGFSEPVGLLYAGGRTIFGFSCPSAGVGTRTFERTGMSVTSGTSVEVGTETFRWVGDVLQSREPTPRPWSPRTGTATAGRTPSPARTSPAATST